MRLIRIEHTTRYEYDSEVRFLPHVLHLRPREGHDIRVASSALRITPAFSVDWRRDLFNNSVAVVSFSEPGSALEIVSDVVVEHYADQYPALFPAESARTHPFEYDVREQLSLRAYQTSVFPGDRRRVAEWMADLWQPGDSVDTVELLDALNQRAAALEYTVRHEPGVQSPARTLRLGRGSCRDQATLFIEACRCAGLASRFVSGYSAAGMGTGADSTTHAWSEVYLPGCGWVGFDSTSGQRVAGDHIATAVHRHPEAVPPVAGDFIGPANIRPRLSVAVQVTPLDN